MFIHPRMNIGVAQLVLHFTVASAIYLENQILPRNSCHKDKMTASTGNRAWVSWLSGSYAHHYTERKGVIEKKGTSWYKRFDLLYFINFKAKTILGFPGIQIPNPRKYYSG